MTHFTIERSTALPAAVAWGRLTDWERHGEAVPFTTVTRSGEGVRSTFTARTALGPLGFDDPMEIVRWYPPDGATAGHCRVEKRGSVIAGWAELTVTPTSEGSLVRWEETASIRGTGKILNLPTALASRRLFGRLLDRLLS